MKDRTSFRVVLDTNVFVAAYLTRSKTSPNREILDRWLDDQFVLLYSRDTLREVIDKLKEKRIEQGFIVELIAYIAVLGEWVGECFFCKTYRRLRRSERQPDYSLCSTWAGHSFGYV